MQRALREGEGEGERESEKRENEWPSLQRKHSEAWVTRARGAAGGAPCEVQYGINGINAGNRVFTESTESGIAELSCRVEKYVRFKAHTPHCPD